MVKNKKFKIGTLYDKLIITKQLVIGDNTGKVYAFINIREGKFIIIGKNELMKRINKVYLNRDNTEIFYIKNCGILYYKEISKVEPIFNIDENTSTNCKIKFNGMEII